MTRVKIIKKQFKGFVENKNYGCRPKGKTSIDMVIFHAISIPELKKSEAYKKKVKASPNFSKKSPLEKGVWALLEHKTSAHYIIDRDGKIYGLVDEKDRAWHAGSAYWRGERDINSCSIGIELIDETGKAYTAQQEKSALELAQNIFYRHRAIKYVLAHSDIAPARKIDPDAHFNWRALALANIGIWIDAPKADKNYGSEQEARQKLLALGYDPNPAIPTKTLLTAFQRHWRPARVDGKFDRSTAYVLDTLIKIFYAMS